MANSTESFPEMPFIKCDGGLIVKDENLISTLKKQPYEKVCVGVNMDFIGYMLFTVLNNKIYIRPFKKYRKCEFEQFFNCLKYDEWKIIEAFRISEQDKNELIKRWNTTRSSQPMLNIKCDGGLITKRENLDTTRSSHKILNYFVCDGGLPIEDENLISTLKKQKYEKVGVFYGSNFNIHVLATVLNNKIYLRPFKQYYSTEFDIFFNFECEEYDEWKIIEADSISEQDKNELIKRWNTTRSSQQVPLKISSQQVLKIKCTKGSIIKDENLLSSLKKQPYKKVLVIITITFRGYMLLTVLNNKIYLRPFQEYNNYEFVNFFNFRCGERYDEWKIVGADKISEKYENELIKWWNVTRSIGNITQNKTL